MSISHKHYGSWALRQLRCRFFVKNHEKICTEVVVEIITGNFRVRFPWGLILPHRWTTRQIYWEINYYPLLDHKLVIYKCHHKILLRKVLIKCKLIFHKTKSTGPFMSGSKMRRNYFLANKQFCPQTLSEG